MFLIFGGPILNAPYFQGGVGSHMKSCATLTFLNGLCTVSTNLEARTPPANPPPGLNFERPKLSHIIKASHV